MARQGAAVAVNDLFAGRARTVADQIVADGGRAETAEADITDVDAVAGMVANVETRLGPVDILVNNAGIPADGFALKQFREMTVDDWEPFIRLNLYGTLHCTRAVVDGMCRARLGTSGHGLVRGGSGRHRPGHLPLRRVQGCPRSGCPVTSRWSSGPSG